jgi:cell division septation protein DedD
MALENKQRVVGIIVLIVFIVLIVPFLFSGKRNRLISFQDKVVSSTEQLSVSSKDKDISGESSMASSQDTSEFVSLESNASSIPIITSTDESTSLSESIVNTSPVVAEKKAPIISKVTPIISKVTPRSAKKTMFWSVQIGSFSDKVRVQKMITSLQGQGYHVFSQKITTLRGSMIRVLVGRETEKSKAVQLADQLKTRLKINGYVVRSRT